MNAKSLLIWTALFVTFCVVTTQRNENMFSPAGCPQNSRPVDCAPKNQRYCGDNQEENQVVTNEEKEAEEDNCEENNCICFEGYIWNEDKTKCVEPSECDNN
ncbi:uncharacterized protein LOC132257397 [Phlebotomus argentipes]|uniref:uncharacterized protein LOC132257397 n=1 Tax=Phlebotomus argentipes TaxID=94469 RepID=UPI002892EB23|nr:uncharacterized protein LOC132257397 [Phlebotomus argentipes]